MPSKPPIMPGQTDFTPDDERAMREWRRNEIAKQDQLPRVRAMERNQPLQAQKARNVAAERVAAGVLKPSLPDDDER